jgi:hypothetical protein
MATLSPPTLKMKPVPVITDDELAALLKACNGRESPTDATKHSSGCCSTAAYESAKPAG